MEEATVRSFPISVTLSVCGMTLLSLILHAARLRDPFAAFLLLTFRDTIARFTNTPRFDSLRPICFRPRFHAVFPFAIVAAIGRRHLAHRIDRPADYLFRQSHDLRL
jgi:hypothetical protein